MTLVTDRLEITERVDAMDKKFKIRMLIENKIVQEFNRALDRDVNKDHDGTIVMAFVRFDCHQFVRDNPIRIGSKIDFDLETFLQILIEEYEEFGVVEEGYADWVVGDAA